MLRSFGTAVAAAALVLTTSAVPAQAAPSDSCDLAGGVRLVDVTPAPGVQVFVSVYSAPPLLGVPPTTWLCAAVVGGPGVTLRIDGTPRVGVFAAAPGACFIPMVDILGVLLITRSGITMPLVLCIDVLGGLVTANVGVFTAPGGPTSVSVTLD